MNRLVYEMNNKTGITRVAHLSNALEIHKKFGGTMKAVYEPMTEPITKRKISVN